MNYSQLTGMKSRSVRCSRISALAVSVRCHQIQPATPLYVQFLTPGRSACCQPWTTKSLASRQLSIKRSDPNAKKVRSGAMTEGQAAYRQHRLLRLVSLTFAICSNSTVIIESVCTIKNLQGRSIGTAFNGLLKTEEAEAALALNSFDRPSRVTWRRTKVLSRRTLQPRSFDNASGLLMPEESQQPTDVDPSPPTRTETT